MRFNGIQFIQRTIMIIAILSMGRGLSSTCLASLEPIELKCDDLVFPLGIDSQNPQLSWKLRAEGNSNYQSAYRVLAASDPKLLEMGKADLWDSGKVVSDEQIDIAYQGQALSSAQLVYWKVRVWDTAGKVGSWSEVDHWTMGLLESKDWGEAEWISHPDWLAVNRSELGYKSKWADSVNTPKWIMIDLGKTYPIEQIDLMALRHTVAERLGFPMSFKVEISNTELFENSHVVVDYTQEPFSNIWIGKHSFQVDRVTGRYVRVYAPVLRKLNGDICLAFNQIEVRSNGENVALKKKVTASDCDEGSLWSLDAVVDGKGLPSSNPLSTKTLLMRRDIQVKPSLKRAIFFVSGLGQYVLSVNATRVGDYKLHPGWSDTGKTVFYEGYDITELFGSGENSIGISLGNGMYNVGHPGDRYTKFIGRYRPLQMRCHLILEYDDGEVETVDSDESWKTQTGPTTYCHIYGGEDFDAIKVPMGWNAPGFEDGDWISCAISTTTQPKGVCCGVSQAAPAIKVIESLSVQKVNRMDEVTSTYDFGQNSSSLPGLKVKGEAGSKIRITPSELLNPDGHIDRSSVGGGSAYWEYTLGGTGEVEIWEPEFYYHGARYYQVERMAAQGSDRLPEIVELELLVLHSSAEPVGSFHCSSELFNQTRDLIRWAQRSNMMSVLTDCPHREKLGWLEQYHLNGPSLRYEWDLKRLYRKGFRDMADAQTHDGLVPDIAPEYVVFPEDYRDSPEWGSALILSAWQQWIWTGDDTVFRRYFDEMKAYIGYLVEKSDDFILDYGLGDWCDIGPGPHGYGQLTPKGLTSTAIFYEDVQAMLHAVKHMGLEGEIQELSKLNVSIRNAFNRKFFNLESGSYANGSQTSNAMPYAIGLVPEGYEEQVFANLVSSLESNDYRLTSGEIGHPYLLKALSKGGRSDIVFKIHHQDSHPGYGYQLKKGATALAETWDANPRASQNHFMLGHIMEWFYGSLAGIQPDLEYPGYKHFDLNPQFVDGIDWVDASYESRYGMIKIYWKREGSDLIHLNVGVPINTTARLVFGAEDDWPSTRTHQLLESFKNENKSLRITEGGDVVMELAPGEYEFDIPLAESARSINEVNH